MQHAGNRVKNALTVDTADLQAALKRNLAVHIPIASNDVIAIARLEFHGRGTTALVDFQFVFRRDIPQDVVARNRAAARSNDTFLKRLLVDHQRLLAIDVLDEISVVDVVDDTTLVGRLLADKRNMAPPTVLAAFSLDAVEVTFIGNDALVSDGKEEIVAHSVSVEAHEFVQHSWRTLNIVPLQESTE